MKCRHCKSPLSQTFMDLGSSPPSNAYLNEETIMQPEKWYPLNVMVCTNCWLVQTEDFVDAAEMFSSDYAYFSSYSTSWLQHASNYVERVSERFNLSSSSTVVEVAANDGYLLQYVLQKGIKCYGIEPTHSAAVAAREKGIEVVEDFFGVDLARLLVNEGHQADLTTANNVLAHVPDINDFVEAFSILLKHDGVATFEFPHLFNMVANNQYDTIYHEHYSYLSFDAVNTIFEANKLTIFDVEELPTHGGSLRVYAQHYKTGKHPVNDAVIELLDRERQAGIRTLDFYNNIQGKVEKIKIDLLSFLIDANKRNDKVVAYGAAAKGNTILNYAGVRPDLLSFVVDKSPQKCGKFMPGSRIPILEESHLEKEKPDYVVILPWNLRNEITDQLSYIREWGGKFVTLVPSLSIS